MQEGSDKKVNSSAKPLHPLDVNYDLLKCKLTLVDKKSDEFKVIINNYDFGKVFDKVFSFSKIIETYTKNTGGYRSNTIIDVWKVEREDEVNFLIIENLTKKKF